MKRYSIAAASTLMLACCQALAGFGSMASSEYDGDPPSVFGQHLIVMGLGAAAGYFIERAYNKFMLDRSGARYSSDYLGGKAGAIIGCFALPLLIGLLR